eukprot:264344_1
MPLVRIRLKMDKKITCDSDQCTRPSMGANLLTTTEGDNRTTDDSGGIFGVFTSVIVIFSVWYAKRLNRLTKSTEYLDMDEEDENAVESECEDLPDVPEFTFQRVILNACCAYIYTVMFCL